MNYRLYITDKNMAVSVYTDEMRQHKN